MAKWPSVPHCYGWLALDARGAWRMRDERAQQSGLPGDKLAHPALLGFINRNIAPDERGCWYFQNGPQRVYLNLEATPYIARTDPQHGLVLHTGEPLGAPAQAFLTENGELIVQAGEKVAQIDDRDVAQLLDAIEIDGKRASDEALMAWLGGGAGELALHYRGQRLTLGRIASADVPARFNFVRTPSPA